MLLWLKTIKYEGTEKKGTRGWRMVTEDILLRKTGEARRKVRETA